MRVIDHEPWSWFLLASGDDALLDVHVDQGPFGGSLLICLTAAERESLDREGRAYAIRLAREIQNSAPLHIASTSPYRARDLTGTLGDQVTRAVAAWRKE